LEDSANILSLLESVKSPRSRGQKAKFVNRKTVSTVLAGIIRLTAMMRKRGAKIEGVANSL
jgi:hypothetical protein